VNWLDVLCLAKCTECIRTATCNSGSDTLIHNGNSSSPRCLPKQPPKHGLNRAPKCKLPCNFVPEVRLFLAHILDVLQQYFRPSTSNFTCLALPCLADPNSIALGLRSISNGTRGRGHVVPRTAYRMNLNPTRKLHVPACLNEDQTGTGPCRCASTVAIWHVPRCCAFCAYTTVCDGHCFVWLHRFRIVDGQQLFTV
jgi:hypothetical protein